MAGWVDGNPFSTIEVGGNGEMQNYFLRVPVVGERIMRVESKCQSCLKVCPSPSPTVPLRNVACGRLSHEMRKHVVAYQ